MTKINKDKSWLWEFTKKIVWIVTIMFVAVYSFACILLIFHPDSTAVQCVIENMSDVFKVTVVGYVVKAGVENITKIRRNSNNVGLFNSARRRNNSDDSGNTRCD